MAPRKIGERASEYAKRRAEMDDDLWLKGFKEGETKVRPWPMPVNDWTSYREHYDGALRRYFPCSEEPDCVGCTSGIERTSARTRKWIMPALDKDGRLQYYKVGGKLYGQLQRREQRTEAKTVADRDFIIVRTGSGFSDTEYDLEPGERYKVKFKDVETKPITEDEMMIVLGQKYDDYVNDTKSEDDEEKADRWDDDDDKKAKSPKRSDKKTAAKGSVRISPPGKKDKTAAVESSNGDGPQDSVEAADAEADAATPADEPEAIDLPKDPSDEQFDTAPTAVIKRWLIARDVPVPSKVARAKLVSMAKEYVPF